MSYRHFTIEERCCLQKYYKKDIVIENKIQLCQDPRHDGQAKIAY